MAAVAKLPGSALPRADAPPAREVAHRRGYWIGELESTIKAQQDEARDLLNQLTRVIDGLQAERWTLGALRAFPPQGSLVGIRFRHGITDERASQVREAAAAELQRHRELGGDMSRFVDGSYNTLLAAMHALIDSDKLQH